MSPERIRAMLQERPFRLFTIHTGDSSTVDVLTPELAFLAPGGRTLTVFTPRKPRAMREEDNEEHRIDVFLITKCKMPVARRGRGGRTRKPAK